MTARNMVERLILAGVTNEAAFLHERLNNRFASCPSKTQSQLQTVTTIVLRLVQTLRIEQEVEYVKLTVSVLEHGERVVIHGDDDLLVAVI